MRQETITILNFQELSEEAKQAAIEKYRNNIDYDLDFFNDECVDQIKEAGFENPILAYSLSYSQGDGLSFKADNYSKLSELFLKVLGKGKEKTAELLANNCTQRITGNNGHYQYANKNQIELQLENYTSSFITSDRIDEIVERVQFELRDIYMDLCSKLKKQGYDDIEYQSSDEGISEILIANDYEFTENGKIY